MWLIGSISLLAPISVRQGGLIARQYGHIVIVLGTANGSQSVTAVVAIIGIPGIFRATLSTQQAHGPSRKDG